MAKEKRSKMYMEEVDKFIVAEMMDGATVMSIIDSLMSPTWGYKTTDNARKAIARVRSKMTINNAFAIEEKIAEYKEMYKFIYQQSKNAAEWRTANQVLDSLVKLESLAVAKIEAKVEDNIIVTFE